MVTFQDLIVYVSSQYLKYINMHFVVICGDYGFKRMQKLQISFSKLTVKSVNINK